jgi:hypothetical protein
LWRRSADDESDRRESHTDEDRDMCGVLEVVRAGEVDRPIRAHSEEEGRDADMEQRVGRAFESVARAF